MIKEPGKVKTVLDSLYTMYGGSYLDTDPVKFPHRFSNPGDIEIVALLSALLAFGNVKQIDRSIENLLSRMGPRPKNFVRSKEGVRGIRLNGFKHRFVDGTQISVLISALGRIIEEEGSLEHAFVKCYTPGDMSKSLSLFVRRIKGCAGRKTPLLKFVLPDPEGGSACKRLFLYLRWMVRREDGVDFGLFGRVHPGDLVIPLDTHVARVSRLLGLTGKRAMTLNAAREITEKLKEFDPNDPVKYDFSLTRIGIVHGCRGVYSERCRGCHLGEVCMVSGAADH